MANSEQIIYLDVNTRGIEAATGYLTGLQKTVKNLGAEIKKTFGLLTITGYLKAAVQSSGNLDKELLVLRLSLGKLKAAIADAVAPVGAVFIPLINQAVWATTRLVKSVGKVISALFGGGTASTDYAEDTQNAAKAQTALTKSSGKLRRSLMQLDEIERLTPSTGDGSAAGAVETGTVNDTLTPQLQAVVDKILSLVKPLREIDFTPAVIAFGKLKEAIAPISQSLFSGLEWAWHNLLVPLAAWTIEDFLPAFLQTLSAAFGVLNEVIVALKPAADWLWENFLKPMGQWAGEKILTALGWLREKLATISGWISENQSTVQKIGLIVAGVAGSVGLVNGALGSWNGLSGTAIGLISGFGNSMGGLLNPMSLVSGAIKALSAVVLLLIANWDTVKNSAATVWTAIQQTWSGAAGWFRSNLLSPLQNGFKSMVNGIIGFINGMISGIVTGINGIVGAVNKLQFTVPNWVPGLGGKSLGFNLKPINMPRIPYLAQGAVLPANKPFMAVVGDQRHGTNVEAPLTTIQEAVAHVMGDFMSSNTAGHQATVNMLGSILEAVLDISIGDDVLVGALSRYQRKLAVVNGGMV